MPVRAYNISLSNFSGSSLTLASQKMCHGTWSTGQAAPSVIPTGKTVTFRSESDGFLTGTEAFVKYVTGTSADGTQTELYIYWDNPYIGTTNAAAFATTGDVPLNGNCYAAAPPSSSSSSGSSFTPPAATPTKFQVNPASQWNSDGLSELYPASSGEGEAGEAGKDLATGFIPVVGIVDAIGAIFGDVGNFPDALNVFIFSLQPQFFGHPASLRKFVSDRGQDMSKGLRAITKNPTNERTISVRRMMGLP